MRTPILIVLLLAASVVADERLVLARKTMEAHVRRGDALRAKGDLDGALKEYRAAVAVYEAAMAPRKKEAPAPVAAPAEKEAPKTPEQRKKLFANYVAVLNQDDATTAMRYDATVQLGGLAVPEGVPILVRVLQNDEQELVRRAAAWSLGRFGKAAAPAVPALIDAVKSAKPYVGYMSDRSLTALAKGVTGEIVSMGFAATLTPEERAKVHAKWVAWWEANQAKFR